MSDRSKKIPLGFQVVNTRTDEALSGVFTRREPARERAAEIYREHPEKHPGIRKLEAYVHEGWKRGVDPTPAPDNAPRGGSGAARRGRARNARGRFTRRTR